MFTGIIKQLGTIKKITATGIEIAAPTAFVKKLRIGDSVAVDGVCLTVAKKTAGSFSADIMPETRNVTTFANLKPTTVVNLELPLSAGEPLGGHIVSGHVSATATIENIKNPPAGGGNSQLLTFKADKAIIEKIQIKGSIAINGISLTVISVKGNTFIVGIIPYTWKTTNLRNLKVRERVNVETEIPPGFAVLPLGKGEVKIAIVSATFHKEITDALEMNCLQTLAENGIQKNQVRIVRVPGALEIPLVAKTLAQQKIYSAIIALGVIHKGKTYHFEQVSNECVRGCMQVSYDYEIPVVYEVLSVYDLEGARVRADGTEYNRGKDAALTALAMIKIMKTL